MSRYIDVEWLKQNFNTVFWSQITKTIDSAPSIDIVRCKECKYRDYWGSCTFLQNKGDAHKPIMTDADDFCSYGVKKGADDEFHR